MALGDTIKDLHGIPIPQVYVPSVGFVALKGAAADAADGSSNVSTTAAMTLEGPPATDPYQATVWAAGELRVQEQPTQQFFTAFDTGLDTTNIWKAPTASGGGVAATSVVASTVLGTGTTANGYSYLESQATFPPESPGWLLVQLAVNLEFAVSLNAYRFWGLGTSPATPTAAAPLTNAVGFEVATTGKMYAVVYASGTRFVVQDLSVATGNSKQPQDANVHSYNIYFRGDKIYWSIDSLDNIVTQTFGGPGPDVNQLPVKATAIANSTPPGASVLLTVNAATVATTSRNNFQISDGIYQWRKATVTPTNSLQVVCTDGSKATYAVNYFGLVPVTGATDIFTITGSATKTIKITRVEFSMTITSAVIMDLVFLKRSTADTLGTVVTANQTVTPYDSASAATTATFQAFTANPTLGTLVGHLGVVKYLAQAPAAVPNVYIKEFGIRPSQCPTLRGITQQFCINLNLVALAGGQLVNLSVEYTEE